MTKKIYISGMMCVHCQKSVQDTLATLTGVNSVKVDLEKKCATLDISDVIADNVIIDAIDNIGFTVDSIE